MVVRLKPDTTESANYEIEVWQHDLDGDRPIYTRQIVLNGSDQAASQQFWVYFLPQPIDKGLPDQSNSQPRDLQRDLQVLLCRPDHRQIAELPLTSTLSNVDPFRDSYDSKPRGSKLILAVSANGAQPSFGNYNHAVGASEDVQAVNIRMSDLPEDPLGYDAVDSILWLGGNPNDLATGSLDTLAALKDYVRFGGKLVVCQPTQNWQDTLGFGDMLPVDVQGIAAKSDFEPLRSMAGPRETDPFFSSPADSWAPAKGPFQMARSAVRDGAVVEYWIDWKQDGSYSDATPFLARKPYGLGQVTWVAQPLTTESAPNNATGWPYVWDKVFGWRSNAYILPDKESPSDPKIDGRLEQFAAGGPLDLGYTFVLGLNLNSKANWLIVLAIVFFVVYWLIAGPGSYAYLVAKKRQAVSWFLFGIVAVAATLVTVLVVQLVLSGPPELKHLSFVRVASDQPTIVYSRFGLYIPKDGTQTIELEETSPASVSYLSPFAEHPQQLGGDVTEFAEPTEYFVPIRDLKSEGAPRLSVDYRKSMKKFQARWVGELPLKITGSVKLDPDDRRLPLSGKLTNETNTNLNDVYLAFNAGQDKDWLIYIPTWPKNSTYDIKKDFARPYLVGREGDFEGVPGENKILSDEIAPKAASNDIKLPCWINYWYSHFRHSGGSSDPNANESDFQYVFPMVSLFDRLPAMPNVVSRANNGPVTSDHSRLEYYNRGTRMINASSSITAGQLVVLASAHGPLPMPVHVNDTPTGGDGTVFYQFILPMDRGKVESPTTRKSE